MAREPLQEKELQIKKTARRRLAGAIAMVVILLIVLPFLLKDQATDSAQDPVKITIVNQGVNNEPIPELEDSTHGFESNINPTEVTGYTQPTVLPSQQDEMPANKDGKTHIALPKVTPVEPVNQGLNEHSKLSQVLDASEVTLPKPSESSTKLADATTKQVAKATVQVASESTEKLANQDKEQLQKKQTEDKAASETKQKIELEKQKAEQAKAAQIKADALAKEKVAEEAKAKEKAEQDKKNAEKLKAEKLLAEKTRAEKLKAEKLKSEALAQEKLKQEKAKEEKAKEEKSKQDKNEATAKATTGKFYVQYGVFSDPKNLENLKNNLKQKGFAVETENVDGTGKKIRLRSKIYTTKDEALKALKSVQASGFNAIVAGK